MPTRPDSTYRVHTRQDTVVFSKYVHKYDVAGKNQARKSHKSSLARHSNRWWSVELHDLR